MSSETDAKLVRMANQIAAFFDTQPHADAAAATADHLTEFWDPRMRAQLSRIVATGCDGLSDTARAAAERLSRRQHA